MPTKKQQIFPNGKHTRDNAESVQKKSPDYAETTTGK